MRGGVSKTRSVGKGVKLSSPRAWGCFTDLAAHQDCQHVFPTCVGVFLSCFYDGLPRVGLPHVRGGVSFSKPGEHLLPLSSPRAWGCFLYLIKRDVHTPVFPTCVGVFLSCVLFYDLHYRLPHVRGGVSLRYATRSEQMQSSPRAWGCF